MKIIQTPNAPQAIGPYAQAIVHNGMLYTAGQIALIPETMQMVEANVALQTKQVLKNLEALLLAAGSDKTKVIKTTMFLKNMADFPIINEIYADFFGSHTPARSTIEVARLPKDALVEIELTAATTA